VTLLGKARAATVAAPGEQVEGTEWELVDQGAQPQPARLVSGGTANDAKIVAVIGASGVGKSSYIKADLLKPAMKSSAGMLIWSPLEKTDNYAGFCRGVVVTKITDLVARLKAGRRAVVYVPSGDDKAVKKQFDMFCRIAWELVGWTILVEELSRVTMPSWSPPAWRNLSTAGRHQGLTLIGVTQRPANVDKDFMGNCSEIRCYRVNYDNDAKVMADALGLPDEWAPTGPGGRAQRVKAMTLIRQLPKYEFFHKNPDLSLRRGVNKAPTGTGTGTATGTGTGHSAGRVRGGKVKALSLSTT
jgi:hypothetical protein